MADKPQHVSYADAGVDVDEGARAVDAIKAAVASTNRPEVIGGLGGFGSCFSMAPYKDMEDPVLVSGTDGVGTKLAIAQLLDRHETVGEDLVAMCVDDVVPIGAEPLFFLDYVAIGKLRAEHVAKIVGGIAEGCRKSGCALVGGEMAEHPGVMNPNDYDLAGFVVGVVDRPKMIGPHLVHEGDVILGLPSSGIHSNGYSLVRKVAIGGKTENLNRALPANVDAVVDRGGEDGPAWDVPPVITYMVRAAGLTPDEAYKTFNMGVGMSVICGRGDVDEVCEGLVAHGFSPFVMGECVPGEGKVTYR